jgi:hypothetical protein
MRRSIFVLFFCVFCLHEVLGQDGFETKYFPATRDTKHPGDPTKPDDVNNVPINIRYMIKKPAGFPSNGPVFYGVAGRVPVTDIKNQYVRYKSETIKTHF